MSDNVSLGQMMGISTATGAVVGISYLIYKLCLKKKFISKCCGGEVNIQNQESTKVEVQVATQPPTPQLSAQTPRVEPQPVSV